MVQQLEQRILSLTKGTFFLLLITPNAKVIIGYTT